MMRALYSGVSGLKVHQTKMDVIGNNIANVNTVGFKGSSASFADVFYQTSQSASGPNAETGTAGRNAIQIGLGSSLNAISTNVSVAGGAQRTDNPFDCMLTGDGFFIVNKGGSNYFTKNGAFTVDGAGTLCTYGGENVMGWQVDSDGNIVKAQVSALHIMAPENQYAEPEATTDAFISGNIDGKDVQLGTEAGVPTQINIYDNVGESFTVKLSVKNTDKTRQYSVTVSDIVDSNDKSIFAKYDETTKKYVPTDITKFKFGDVEYTATVNADTGAVTLAHGDSSIIAFNPSNGAFSGVYKSGATGDALTAKDLKLDLSATGTDFTLEEGNTFSNTGVNIDFSSITGYSESKTSKLEPTKGTLKDRTGAGVTVGNMTNLSIDQSGKIYGIYSNGTNKLLGQIAVATFSNPAGLEAMGGTLFQQTRNSGEFDGIGQDPTSGNGKIDTGVLEMSNVDLSTEFTNMITTQRGFQANSRIITTSDTLLEELINLKR